MGEEDLEKWRPDQSFPCTQAMGDEDLEKRLQLAIEKLQRGLPFSASLYI